MPRYCIEIGRVLLISDRPIGERERQDAIETLAKFGLASGVRPYEKTKGGVNCTIHIDSIVDPR